MTPALPMHRRNASIAVFVACLALYSVSATWSFRDQNVDTIAATLPAWHLVAGNGADLSAFQGVNPWIVDTEHAPWTNRPPGLVAVATVAHALALPFGSDFSGIPGSVASVLSAAGAVAILFSVIDRHLGRRPAVLGAIAVAAGSGLWTPGSGELTPHAVGAFLLAWVVGSLSRDDLVGAGLALGAALTVRPPIAIAAAVLGIALALQRHSIRPLFALGAPSVVGLGALLAFNRVVYGAWSVAGGYATFLENGSTYRTPAGYLSNLAGTLFDPANGLLIWSAWLIPLTIAATRRSADIEAPDWQVSAAMAAMAYLLVHTALNRYWGGMAFGYRYAIEPLVLALPWLMSGVERIPSNRAMRSATIVGLGLSVLLHGLLAFALSCVQVSGAVECTLL